MAKLNKLFTYSCCFLTMSAHVIAQDEEEVEELEEFVAEESISDELGILTGDADASSVFGLDLKLSEVPRNITLLSGDAMDKFGIDTVYDLSKISAGTFSTSFFGIEGQPTIRGSFAEVYFRGMKRIENPGNYPTPLGTSYNLEIVRGPASPIYGPAKMGGYVNIVPKSARASTSKLEDGTFGSITAKYGSYEKKVVEIEYGGTMEVFGKKGGFYGYLMGEDSDSFYHNVTTSQYLGLFGIDLDITDTLRIETGLQYHRWEGVEVGGWNRVTQDLIDNQSYIRGAAQPLDTNGDGFISDNETAGLTLFVFGPFGSPTPEMGLIDLPDGTPAGSTSTISPRTALVDPEDDGLSKNSLFYFDLISTPSDNLKIENKTYFEHLDRFKYATYVFSQDTTVATVENKTIVTHDMDITENIETNNAIAGSVRYYDAEYRDDFFQEYFDRRDLIFGPTPADRFRIGINDPSAFLSNSHTTEYYNYGLGVMSNTTFFEDFRVILGGHYDYIDIESRGDAPFDTGFGKTSDSFWTYSASLSYTLPTFEEYFRPTFYITSSRQEVLNTTQAGSVLPGLFPGGILNRSELEEAGVKIEALDDKLFASLALYNQKTTSFSAQSNQNQAVEGEGIELEVRYTPVKNWSIIGTATWQKTKYSPNDANNDTFMFANSAIAAGFDPTIDPTDIYGGTYATASNLVGNGQFEEVPGLPDKALSLSTVYEFPNGFGFIGSATYYAAVSADRTKTIQLPDATLFDLGAFYKNDDWEVQLLVKNITDELWFRNNFSTLFGAVTVLPQPGTTWELSVTRSF